MKLGEIYENDFMRQIEIFPMPLSHPRTTITITQRTDFIAKGEWNETEINWQSIGAHNAADTELFTKAMSYAVKTAKRWDAERVK